MPTIKINRALKLSAIGRYPGSADAMLDNVPRSVLKALTAQELATLLDAMWDTCQEAKGLAARDAISEGVIWDTRRQRLVEILTTA